MHLERHVHLASNGTSPPAFPLFVPRRAAISALNTSSSFTLKTVECLSAGHHKNRLVAASRGNWLDENEVVAQMLLTKRFIILALMKGLSARTALYRSGHWDQEGTRFIFA